MNFAVKTTARIVSLIISITGIAMLPSFAAAAYFGETNVAGIFAVLSPICIILGTLGYKFIPRSRHALQARDAYIIVLSSWLICSLISAIPYYASEQLPTFADSIFEAVAGYTTTGASSYSDLILSDAMQLWKSTTHWMGGMGILVFIITILPALGPGGPRIVAAESPGSGLSRGAPKSRDLAKMLYAIYTTMTLATFLLLNFGSKMGPMEALINAMSCVSTSGLLMHPDGLAYYNSVFVEGVICVSTILASFNFLLFIYLARKNFEDIAKNIELRVFLAIIGISSVAVSLNLYLSHTYESLAHSFRMGIFQCTAFMTTSGFSVGDYATWPTFSKMFLFSMLFVGGCVASTAGGIKVTRVMIAIKLIRRSFFRKLHPRSVRTIKLGEIPLKSNLISSVTSFIMLYFGVFLVGSAVLSLQGLDLETTLSSTASLLSTTGLAFGKVGDSGSFEMFSPAVKLFMSLLMIIGRLELFTVILVFFPSFWNADKGRSK